MGQWERLKNSTPQEIEAFRVQNAVHENLLLSLDNDIDTLESALNANRIAIARLSERIEEFEKIGVVAPELLEDLSDRIAIAEKRLSELKGEGVSEGQNREIYKKLKNLLDILYAKKKQGSAFIKKHADLLDTLSRTHSDLAKTRQQLQMRLQSQTKAKLFERHLLRFKILNVKNIAAELNAAAHRVTQVARPTFWTQQWLKFQYVGGTAQAIFLVLFFTVVLLRKKIWRLFQKAELRLEGPDGSARQLAVMLFRRSFFLICASFFLWLYDLLKLPYINYHIVHFLNQAIFTLLLTRWGVDYFQNRLKVFNSDLNQLVQKRCVNLFRILRIIIIIHLALIGIVDDESITVWLFGLTIQVFLAIWTIRFWRAVDDKMIAIARRGESAPSQVLLHSVRGWNQLVVGAAIVIDLIGYHTLAGHWLISWAKTFALILWAYLGWLAIQEWHQSQKAVTVPQASAKDPKLAAPVGWLVVQMTRLLWFSAVLAGTLTSWAGSDFTLKTIGAFFKLDFSVGSLTVSVKGILLAIVLFFRHPCGNSDRNALFKRKGS